MLYVSCLLLCVCLSEISTSEFFSFLLLFCFGIFRLVWNKVFTIIIVFNLACLFHIYLHIIFSELLWKLSLPLIICFLAVSLPFAWIIIWVLTACLLFLSCCQVTEMYRLSALPQAARGEVQCGWFKLIRGSWKTTHLAVFLKPPGVGEVGMVRALMCEWATRFSTLNSKIPKCSDVTYESRIWGEVASWNT